MLRFFTTTLIFVLLGFTLSSNQALSAQEVRLKNGSFEGEPTQGLYNPYKNTRTQPPPGWFDCGSIHFPSATPPDIHQGSTNFWDNSLGTNDGKTYLAMVVREDDSYESVSQTLTGTLRAGKCYTFSIFLAKSEKYMSATRSSDVKTNFSQPAVLRVWGGNLQCDQGDLLAESEPVDHGKWREYSFKIEPAIDCRTITLEAFYKTPTLFGYNGHICLDNASNFRIIDCDEPEVILAAAVAPKPKKKVLPPHKRKKKQDTVEFNRGKKEVKVDTVVYERPKILDLERKNMKMGLTIKLEKLYFEDDSSGITIESFPVLNEISQFLQEYPEITVEVGGHTNSQPKDDYCDSLSTLRAKSVSNYLIKSGIEQGRVTFKGYGKRQPIATNNTRAGRRKNQRVQVKITGLDYNRKEEEKGK